MNLDEVFNLNHGDDFIFAVTIGKIDNYLHSGILYKWDNEIRAIDFFRQKIRNPSIGDLSHLDFIYVKYDEEAVFEDLALQVPAICEVIREKNDSISFGIKFTESRFDEKGNLIHMNGDFGLTCATFVLAILNRIGIEWVDLDSWEEREEDKEWQKYILEKLKEQNLKHPESYSLELIAEYEKNIGCFRYRPEEIAVASGCSKLPAKYSYCTLHSKYIIDAIDNGIEYATPID